MDIISLITIFGFAGFFGWIFLGQRRAAKAELGRFSDDPIGLVGETSQQFNSIFAKFAMRQRSKQTLAYHLAKALKSENDMNNKFAAAGLEGATEQGKFLIFRIICFLAGPGLGALTYLVLPRYYATICTLMTSGAGIIIPLLWLRNRAKRRTEEIQRELPLVLDLTNLGTSAGWDVGAALERVIEALNIEFSGHPLIRELNRGRWLAASGYTWDEALKRVAQRLGDDTVRRTTLALAQAIKQGGDRSKQLDAIAEDAQRNYYSELDKRLAALPVKALMVTMLLMCSYMVVLLAPAAVQVKNIMFK